MILSPETRTQFLKLRKRESLSQKSLASLANVPQSSVSNLETGTSSIRNQAIARIADCLGIDARTAPELAQTPPPGDWLSVGQAAESTGTPPYAISQQADRGDIPGAAKTENGRWLIPGGYENNALRPVYMDSILGLGNQYRQTKVSDLPEKKIRELRLTQGVAIFHTERLSPSTHAITLEALTSLGWTEVWRDDLDDSCDGVIKNRPNPDR